MHLTQAVRSTSWAFVSVLAAAMLLCPQGGEGVRG
jgi:hypothetical protein